MTIAVLGLGSIGMRHAVTLLDLGERVVAFDPDANRCKAFSARGGETVRSREEALEVAEAVVIATPNRFHRDDLAAAVMAGRHVFVEKPLAHCADGLAEILDQADQANRTVFVGFNTRFNPAVREARNDIRAGKLGSVFWARLQASSYLPDWRPHQDHRTGYAADPMTGGILFDAIHEFDTAYFLFGPGRTVAAAARCSGVVGIPSDDCADVVISHRSGPQSCIHVDYLTRPPRRRIEVAGERGVLEIDVRGRRLQLIPADGGKESSRVFNSTIDQEYVEEMKAFLACVRDGAAPPLDGSAAVAVLQQVLDARKLCGLPTL